MTAAPPQPAASTPAEPAPRPGRFLADVADLFLWPDRLFARLPVHNRWVAAVLLLMALQALYGLGLVSTGVPDYEIAERTQREVRKAAARLRGDDTSEELTRTVEALEKGQTFSKLFVRVMYILGGPLRLLAGVLVVASVLYAAAAFRQAARPDWTLLAGVVAFATFVEVPRLLLRLLLVATLHVSRVETSAAAFVSPAQTGLGLYLMLRRLDPFDLWFWILVGYGAWRTGQLGRRWAVLVVVALALAAAVGTCVTDVPDLADVNVTVDANSP